MKRKRAVCLANAIAAILFASTLMRAQDVTIVVHRTVSVSQISETELRDIFTGARYRFSDGSRAIPVLLKGGPAHEVFLHRHIGDTSDEFRARWRKAVFTGQGSMPKEFSSEEAMLTYIEATPGAIGYVSRAPANQTVKLLTVSGKR